MHGRSKTSIQAFIYNSTALISFPSVKPYVRRFTEPLDRSLLVKMSPLAISVTEIQVDSYVFPPAVKPPCSKGAFFLAGAGERTLEIQGKSIKFTAIGVYLEESAVPWLASKWKGKTADELTESVEFFRDIVTGPFEKFTQVTMILPLTGKQYSEKVTENCSAIWKAVGIYTDAEAKAIDKFLEVFQDESFPPGASILFTQSPLGSLTISFSKEYGTIPEAGHSVIENLPLSEAVLESIIGKQGVSPVARRSVAGRLSELLNSVDVAPADSVDEGVAVQAI